jgi:hypothetical protein
LVDVDCQPPAGHVGVAPAMLNTLKGQGIADKELSTLPPTG